MEVLLTVSSFPPLKKTLKWKNFSSTSHNCGFPLHVFPRKRNCVDRAFCMEDTEIFSLETKPETRSGFALQFYLVQFSAMLCYASNGFLKAKVVWDEISNSSFVPGVRLGVGKFDMVNGIIRKMQLKNPVILPDIYAQAVSCFGKRGHLECMDFMIKEMVSMGFSVDSVTRNSYLLYYSVYGSLAEMEVVYGRLKRSRILIEEEAIRAMSFAILKKQ